jgi:hypothetical protein
MRPASDTSLKFGFGKIIWKGTERRLQYEGYQK